MAETVAFLFSDLEGSTRLLSSVGPDTYGEILSTYREIMARAAAPEEGRVVDREGDGLFLVFPTPTGALRAAARAQSDLVGRSWLQEAEVRARMGVHAGEVHPHDDGYVGLAIHGAARVAQAGWGGQVLVSDAVRVLVADDLPEGVGLRDLGEHRLKDLARVQRIFQLDAEELPGDFPPLRTPDVVPNNLPTLATSFVGRDQEMAEVEKLIRGARLLTITGVGGAGKTRVALQVAAELGDEYPDGTWLVELAAITDPELIDAVAANALRVAQQSGRSIRESIVDHLAGREALLIVDNCEHLINGAAEFVTEVLAGAPDCRLIATSRELLGIGGEVAYGLQPLQLPRRNESPPPSELARYDAVRLFVERAQASQPSFRLTPQAAPAVVEICHRLDGMPLALELAAARLRSFSLRQIADNLDQRFRLLTGGSRTALPRQQTLAAAIDWSYRLLAEPERGLFERLSVFRGGFTLEAAGQVCADDRLDALGVLELLPALVDKSLVAVDTEREEARYRLLETIHQFARDRLDETGTADEFRRRHARFFRDLAVQAGRHIRGPEETRWWERIDTELDNLRQAMTWAMEAGEPELALEIAGGFWRFWWFKARWGEGISWLGRTVEAAGPAAPKHLRAQGLLGYGSLLEPSAQHADAEQILWESFELYAELEREGADRELLLAGYAAALINIAVEIQAQGRDPEEVSELNRRALEIARRIEDPAATAVALGNLAESAAEAGEVSEARRLFAEALAASRALHSSQRLADMNWQLGFFELASGALERARSAFERSLAHAQEAGLTDAARLTHAYLAVCDADVGHVDARHRFAAQVSQAFENPDLRNFLRLRQTLLVLRASLDATAGELERAARVLGASRALEDEGTAVDWALRNRRDQVLGEVRADLGDPEAEATIERGRQLADQAVIELIVG